MDKLIECMLPVSPRLSPHNGSGGVVDMRTTTCDILSIGFHVTLIKKKVSMDACLLQNVWKETGSKKESLGYFFLSILKPNLKLTYQTIRSKVYICMKPMRITQNKDTRMVIGEGKHKWRTGHNWLCLTFFQLKGWCAFLKQITKFSETRVKQFRIAPDT